MTAAKPDMPETPPSFLSALAPCANTASLLREVEA
jgi:hypothetical protein